MIPDWSFNPKGVDAATATADVNASSAEQSAKDWLNNMIAEIEAAAPAPLKKSVNSSQTTDTTPHGTPRVQGNNQVVTGGGAYTPNGSPIDPDWSVSVPSDTPANATAAVNASGAQQSAKDYLNAVIAQVSAGAPGNALDVAASQVTTANPTWGAPAVDFAFTIKALP